MKQTAIVKVSEGRQLKLWHAVAVTVGGGFLIGPGCWTALGAVYGSPKQGFFFGCAVLAAASVFILPTLIKRGVRRSQ